MWADAARSKTGAMETAAAASGSPPNLTFTYPVFFLVVSFRDTSSAFYPPTKKSPAPPAVKV